jgi:hypothetical protein
MLESGSTQSSEAAIILMTANYSMRVLMPRDGKLRQATTISRQPVQP